MILYLPFFSSLKMGVMSWPVSDFFLTDLKYSFEARFRMMLEPDFFRSVFMVLVICSPQNS